MVVLALDCSGDACAAALVAAGETRAWRRERLERGHAERIAPMLAEVLEEAGVRVAELDLVAATVGPGAFTGVRIGLAAAQGLARAAGIAAVGVTVTEAIAADIPVDDAAREGRSLLVAVDSRRSHPFGEWFDPVDGAWRGRGPMILDTNGTPPIAPKAPPPVLAGSAAATLGDWLPGARAMPNTDLVDPATVARLAAAGDAARPPVPLYLRPPDVSAPSRDQHRRGTTP
jgi:tRNA threonylcarbamoyladenosine biosynthesis protein TsaB